MRARAIKLMSTVSMIGAALMMLPSGAAAHPLGNSSVNAYERVELTSQVVRIRYILDVAEIPADRERRFADTNDDDVVDDTEATTYLDGLWSYVASRLTLTLDGQVVLFTVEDQALSFPPGQGGLTLLRAVFNVTAPMPSVDQGTVIDGTLRELTFDGVQGWHEIIVVEGDGVSLEESDVPSEDQTDELTVYPEDMLTNPLVAREAAFRFAVTAAQQPTAAPSSAPPTTASPSARPSPQPTAGPAVPVSGGPSDPLVALIGPELTLGAMAAGVLIAIALGAAHAISPGHGKTLVAAYIIGSRANIGQAAWLGLTVALTHTAGVLVLGAMTYMATQWLIPERVVGWLSVITGGLILAMGAFLVWRAWRTRGVLAASHHHVHPHGTGGAHGHHHGPEVGGVPNDHVGTVLALRGRDVAALGIVGGLIPSTSALLLLLSSVALEQVAFGIVLIVAFGVGMALVLAGIATGIVLLRRSPLTRWERLRDPRLARFAALVPVVSGFVVIAVGLVLTFEALRTLR